MTNQGGLGVVLLVLLLGFSYCLSEDILGYGTKFGTELDGDSQKVIGGSLPRIMYRGW